MSESQQLERILEIDRQIRAGMYPDADSIAAKFETGRRVIFKDREFLLRLGAPLAYNREHKGWYYTDPTFALPGTYVTEGELLAFFLSVEIARRHLGTRLEKSLCGAAEKIARTLKGRVKVELGSLAKYCSFEPAPTALVHEETLLRLYQSIEQSRQVELRYLSASKGEETERTVDPYHLYNREGNWYLIAHDHLRGEIRTFHLERIRSMQALQTGFLIPPGFNSEEWIRDGFQAEHGDTVREVAIRFDTRQARWIRERQIHETQRIEECPGGGVILRLRTSGLDAVKRWVMQYGTHAEVLEPPVLRKAVAEELRNALRVYEADDRK
jgi:predicted DNA-binding transcriptional regulator YafY